MRRIASGFLCSGNFSLLQHRGQRHISATLLFTMVIHRRGMLWTNQKKGFVISYFTFINGKTGKRVKYRKPDRIAGKSLLGLSILPLASCKEPHGIFVQAPPPGPEPEFIENPTNTFTARDDNNRFFKQLESTENLTVIGKGGNDNITTGSGDDVIRGGSGNDYLVSSAGNDNVDGEAGGDHILTGGGDDIASGGTGNDFIYGDTGNDTLNGGDGSDLLAGGGGADTLNGGAGNDVMIFHDRASDINDRFDGGDGYDNLQIAPTDLSEIDILGINVVDIIGVDIFGFLNDTSVTVSLSEIDAVNIEEIKLNNGDSEITITAQDVTNVTDQNNRLLINGDLGAKVIGDISEWSSYSVEAIDGKIFYTFSNATSDLLIQAELLRVGLQADEPDYSEDAPNIFTARDDTDSLIGKQNSTENLTITGKEGNDRILTGYGQDIIQGAGGNDQVKSGDGNDVIYGGDGNDNLSGQDGDDEIYGGQGVDEIFGGNNDDLLYGGDDSDFIIGGFGDDIIYGDGGNDVLMATLGNDTLYGGAGNDILHADFGNNILHGGAGNDTLFKGISGNDIMNGDEGDDEIWASNGDVIDGGTGYDTWIITTNNIDFSQLTATNMEEIKLGGNPLSFSLQDILDITDGNNKMIISGSTDAIVTSENQDWILGEDQTIDGEVYHTYTSGDATLLVDVDITQDIS